MDLHVNVPRKQNQSCTETNEKISKNCESALNLNNRYIYLFNQIKSNQIY